MAAPSLKQPVFCFTCDTDWNSDTALSATFDLFKKYEVKLTVFATHASPVYARYKDLQIGVHPNFLPGSTHGSTVDEVLNHVFRLFPDAETYRSHSYYDSQQLSEQMARRGVKYDANLCLYLEKDIRPLRHCHGAMRFPSFLDDNIHWHHNGSWSFEKLRGTLLTPGLKIFNFHPYPLALNIPSLEYYVSKRSMLKTLSNVEMETHRFDGDGPLHFLEDLLSFVSNNYPSYHLGDLYRAFRTEANPGAAEVRGRPTMAADYSSATVEQRQALVREQYDNMDATHVYITSRDYNLRELEIDAIERRLVRGRILDCGCGNGYTLLALAKRVPNCDMLGVDFSKNLLGGAEALRERFRPELRSTPQFECHNVINYLAGDIGEFDTIINERLVVNLPTRELQAQVISNAVRHLAKGGVYLLVEGTQSGFETLNRLRQATGLEAIPDVYAGNESSLKLDPTWLKEVVRATGTATIEAEENFSFYNLASKVLHPLMVAPDEPKFSAPVNAHAATVQRALVESRLTLPDIGAGKVWVIRKVR